MGRRFFSAALLLPLIASDASAATLVTSGCRPKFFERVRPVRWVGLKATMQIEVPPGGTEALRADLQPFAASHDLRFRTWGYDDQIRHVPPTMLVETKLQGVIIKIEVPEGSGAADIQIHTTCYADEEWQPRWSELKEFVAARNYRILSLNDVAGTRGAAETNNRVVTIDIRLLSLPPLYPVKIEQ